MVRQMFVRNAPTQWNCFKTSQNVLKRYVLRTLSASKKILKLLENRCKNVAPKRH